MEPKFAPPRIDLYSDTQSKPSPAMRKAMASADVGDEQRNEDPTVCQLQGMVSEFLNKEAALFLPSGTMGNAIAYRVWTEPGQEVILDKTSHVLHSEAGGAAALSGVMMRPLEGVRGVFTEDQVLAAVRPVDRYNIPQSAMVSIEQTVNAGGGCVWPLSMVETMGKTTKDNNLALHMDGARLINAVVAKNVPASAYAAPCNSLWIDLSKGLGCPIGAVIAGKADFISQARRFKHQFGGAMRQAGIIAAAGVYALENNIERIVTDHENAHKLAEGIANIKGLTLEFGLPETNMVYFTVDARRTSAMGLSDRLWGEFGIRIGVSGTQRFRAVTHIDISDKDIDETLSGLNTILKD